MTKSSADRIKIESSDEDTQEGSTPSASNVQHQQQEQKLLQALRAAAAADDILRAQGVVLVSGGKVKLELGAASFDEQQRRATAINDIDKSDFVQATFKSSRTEIPLPSGSSVDASHAGAMFGTSHSSFASSFQSANHSTALSSGDSLMHPNLYVGVDEKMERWRARLMQLRARKLQQVAAAGANP